MWKILFFTVFVAAFADAKFQLKGKAQQRLRTSLEEECKKYAHSEIKVDNTYNAFLTGVSCLYGDKDYTSAINMFRSSNTTDTFLDATRAMCSIRSKILPCYRAILMAFSPCAPPSVREQIDTMQASFENLAEFVCERDCARLRKYFDDGGYVCMDSKTDSLNRCTANLTDLITELPEDTTTFKAIDTCFRYDAMVACFNDVLKSCPKESTLNFVNSIFTQFRKGTYCHITLPLEKEDDVTSETDENEESNAEDNKL